MHSMVIIVQTFTSALAFEYGPYPDLSSCESAVPQYEEHVRQLQPTLMAMMSECREIATDPALIVDDNGFRAMPDSVS